MEPCEEQFSIPENQNLQYLEKAYAEGDLSMAEIIQQMELKVDIERGIPRRYKYVSQNLNIEKLKTRFESKCKKVTEKTPAKYIPGKVFFPNDVDSVLTKREQAICLSMLKLRQSGSNMSNLSQFETIDVSLAMGIQAQVQIENTKFLEYVKNDWNGVSARALNLHRSLKQYALADWEKKLTRALNYPEYYKYESIIPFSCQETESQVSVNNVAVLCEVGTVPKFIEPCLEIKRMLPNCALPVKDSSGLTSKLSVSEDPNITRLVEKTPVDIVISSGGLKQLMDDTNSNSQWSIPIVVRKLPGDKDTTIVYIDKPIAKRHPTPLDFNYYCRKLLLKTNFCCFPGITTTTPNIQTPLFDVDSVETHQRKPMPVAKEYINYEDELQTFSELVEKCKTSDDENSNLPSKNYKIFHNASYRLWSMKSTNQKHELLKTNRCNKDLKVLIRCKMDACDRLPDGTLRPLVVVPKLEQQLEHGANVPTKKEIIDQWTALFFRPFSHLIRVRMQCDNAEIVEVQKISLQQLNNEAITFYNFKPHLRLNTLYEIFSKLTEQEPGNYVLRNCYNKGPFIEIYKECYDSQRARDIFNFHHFYGRETCYYTIPKTTPWTPIDPTHVLPVHNTFKRMPGMFKPLLVKKLANKKKKNWTLKKKLNAVINKTKQRK